jgi:hypothetical protein
LWQEVHGSANAAAESAVAIKKGAVRVFFETDEMVMLESQKGSRLLHRPPRKRGGVAARCAIDGARINTSEAARGRQRLFCLPSTGNANSAQKKPPALAQPAALQERRRLICR